MKPSSVGLTEALDIDGGIVCAVGAGGKKTVLWQLARETRRTCALANTVPTSPPPASLWEERLVLEETALRDALPETARRARRILYAAPSDKPGRLGGHEPGMVACPCRRRFRTDPGEGRWRTRARDQGAAGG